MSISDINTLGYTVIPNFISRGDVERLILCYNRSITGLGENKNYRVVSSVEYHCLEERIHPILRSIREATDLTVDMCYRGSMYFKSGDIDFKWHQDHETYYLTQQARNSINFWIPLIKPQSRMTGVSVVPYTRLKSYSEYFWDRGAQNITVIDGGTISVEDCESGATSILNCDIESLAESPEIAVGDALVMRGDVLHRTQDTLTTRLAMSIRCFCSDDLIDRDRFYSGCEHKHTMIQNNARLYGGLKELFKTQDKVRIGDVLPVNLGSPIPTS